MQRYPVLYLSCIIAGFALLKVPISGFLVPLSPLFSIIGVLAIIIFSLVLIFQGLMSLLGK